MIEEKEEKTYDNKTEAETRSMIGQNLEKNDESGEREVWRDCFPWYCSPFIAREISNDKKNPIVDEEPMIWFRARSAKRRSTSSSFDKNVGINGHLLWIRGSLCRSMRRYRLANSCDTGKKVQNTFANIALICLESVKSDGNFPRVFKFRCNRSVYGCFQCIKNYCVSCE